MASSTTQPLQRTIRDRALTGLELRPLAPEIRPSIPDVTLCAVSSVNMPATVAALQRSLAHADFAACVLLSDVTPAELDPRIRHVTIDRLETSIAYSHFMLKCLVDYVSTRHCLLVQWDGFVLDGRRWNPQFLDYDYIGAVWPQFDDGFDVGNGGFSLRSRRLMSACQSPDFQMHHPEDVAIGRTNRAWLEAKGMRFADEQVADTFSCERQGKLSRSFGFHGVFNMPDAIGPEEFWTIYRGLDDRTSARTDARRLLRDLRHGKGAVARRVRLWADRYLRSPFL